MQDDADLRSKPAQVIRVNKLMGLRFLKLKNEKGAAAVEFALLLPVLALILFGIMMFGLMFNYYLEITHAAREGVRWAALRAPLAGTNGVIAKAKAAAPGISLEDDDIDMSGVHASGATDADQGLPVTVTVTYNIVDLKDIFGDFAAFLPDEISSSATQKVE